MGHISDSLLKGYQIGLAEKEQKNKQDLYDIQKQESQMKLDDATKMHQATSLYGNMQSNLMRGNEFDRQGAASMQDYLPTMQAQGLGIQGAQVANQAQQQQMADPKVQAQKQWLSTAAGMAVTAPNEEYEPTMRALYKQGSAQGIDFNKYGITNEDDMAKLPRSSVATMIADPKMIEDLTQKRMELLGGGKLSSEQNLIKNALKEKLGRNPTYTEINDTEQKQKIDMAKVTGQSRAEAMGSTKGGTYFDLSMGKTVPATWNDVNKSPGRYVAVSDADVKTLASTKQYANVASRMIDRLDTLGDWIAENMGKYGINENAKIGNIVSNYAKAKGLGAGDLNALQNAINGYGAEIGKLESGSFGNAAASVEALKSFHVDNNMPVGEFLKFNTLSKEAGGTVRTAANNQLKGIYESIYAGTPYEGKIPSHVSAGWANTSTAPQPSIITARNPKTGQRIKSSDGGKTWQAM